MVSVLNRKKAIDHMACPIIEQCNHKLRKNVVSCDITKYSSFKLFIEQIVRFPKKIYK